MSPRQPNIYKPQETCLAIRVCSKTLHLQNKQLSLRIARVSITQAVGGDALADSE